jgi:hypothetical protein
VSDGQLLVEARIHAQLKRIKTRQDREDEKAKKDERAEAKYDILENFNHRQYPSFPWPPSEAGARPVANHNSAVSPTERGSAFFASGPGRPFDFAEDCLHLRQGGPQRPHLPDFPAPPAIPGRTPLLHSFGDLAPSQDAGLYFPASDASPRRRTGPVIFNFIQVPHPGPICNSCVAVIREVAPKIVR